MSNMPPRIRAQWAKEMVLLCIDDWIKDNADYELAEFDDRRAVEKERDRIAKLYKLPLKYGG